MSGLNDTTPVIQGGTDGTEIGNISDSLKNNVTNAAGASAVNIQDGGNSITVDAVSLPLPTGASTSALQTTGNTSVASIDTKTPPLGQTTMAASTPVVIASNQSTLPISAASLPLPTGAATAALQTQPGVDIGDVTINNASGASAVNIQDGGNSITVDGSVTVSGTVAATQSGVWTVQPGNTANTTAWKVDGSAVTQPISAVSLPLPTGAATSANQTTEITSLQLIDDVPAAINAPFVKGGTIMGQLDDTGTTAATEDNVAPVRITPQRAAHVNFRNQAGTEIGTNANPVRIDPTGTTTQPSNVTNAAGASAVNIQDGGNSITVDGAVTVSGTVAATQSGTWTVQPGNTANTTAWKVDGSAVTQPVSAASLPLPTGASTSALQTTGNTSVASIDTKTPPLGQTTMAASTPVVIASNQSTVPVSAASLPLPTGAATAALQTQPGVDIGDVTVNNAAGAAAVNVQDGGNSLTIDGTVSLAGYKYSSFQPDPSNYATTNQTSVSLDASGRLETHSVVNSDEGSFRDDFSGSGLTTALTGTLAFTNGGFSVIGTGTSFSTQAIAGMWIKKTADAESAYVQIDSVLNDTTLNLSAAYTGTTASGVTGVAAKWKPTTGTGGSFSVASSVVTIASGTTNAAATSLQTPGDYLPYTLSFYAAITQRIANQAAIVGFIDSLTGVNKQCLVSFSGTNNTQVNFITSASSAASDIQTTTVTLPNSGVTSAFHTYKIDLSANQAALTIDGILVATQILHIPGPYDVLSIAAEIKNTGVPASTTSLQLDYMYFSNWDRLQIDNDFSGEPMPVSGNLIPVDGSKATYSASATGLTVAATATDIFTLTGSASKTIRITKFEIAGTQTTTGVIPVLLVKRSTADTGGTSSTLTGVPHDSLSPTATATARSYTANPTVGTAVGTFRSGKLHASTTLIQPGLLSYDFGDRPAQAMVLRGINDVIAVNLNSTTVAGSSFSIYMEWTEET